MRLIFRFFILCFPILILGQNVVTDSQTYSPQQLIENILIDSNCITNVLVTNTIGGNFGGPEKSFGFFDATGTTFPFQTGIVLSTGKLSNVQGPNTTLSDDDATNWNGDSDLENALQETGTLNATILEFDFISIANQISFRYIFASEEYQENDSNTCRFSDLFGFLIRPVGSSTYDNIALVPGTNTPVKVTTVHPEIPNGCEAENEAYFESFNDATAPINFNGQTKVLTATATTIPNQIYHVKLVIADEQNFRFDSAVFLEAGSFKLTNDLGPDRLITNRTALCDTETLTLNATQTNAVSYQWFKNGVSIMGEIFPQYTVVNPGTYYVEVTLNNACISEGSIEIEYSTSPIVNNTSLSQCDANQNGLTTYNLYDAENNIITNTNDLVFDFYLTENDALNELNDIQTATTFQNTTVNQIVYALVGNQSTNCKSIAEVTLTTSNNTITVNPLNTCENAIIDGFTTFDLNEINTQIQSQLPANSMVSYFSSEIDALQNLNLLNTNFINTVPFSQVIYVKVSNSINNNCFNISQTTLNVLERPQTEVDYNTTYCINNFPDTISITGNIINPQITDTYNWFFNGNLLAETSTILAINDIGVYTFQVTNANFCTATQTITVTAIETPIIETIELTPDNTITILTSNLGDFEFALDNPNLLFQDSNTFITVSPGKHIAYVREKNGCGISQKEIYVIGFPSFFTPNGDGFHDYWKPKGFPQKDLITLDIKIFDRYGKLLKQINPPSLGWDGTFNNILLPTNDYWYVIKQKNGTTYTGHFTLKR